MKYFNNINTLDELKKKYRELCLTMHPDKGGDKAAFQEMSAEYEQAAKNVEGSKQYAQEEAKREEAEARRRERQEEEARAARQREEERKAREEEERREAERIAKAQEENRAAVRAWAHILERIPETITGKKRAYDFADKKAAAAYVAATKRNVQAVINHYFPGLKVKVTISGQIYKEYFGISWEDGPTEEEVEAIPELDFFISSYYESDPYCDYGTYKEHKTTAPWREAYGGTLGDCTRCEFSRTLSEEGREAAARIASEYFKNFDPDKMQRRNETFTATWQEFCNFADAFNIKNKCRCWETLVRSYGHFNSEEVGVIYYSSFNSYLKEYVKVEVTKKETAPEFAPQYGKTYKAVKKALSGNDFCTMQYNEKKDEKEWQPVDIFAALLDGLQGVHICKPYNYSDEKHWSRLYSTSYTIARNRVAKFAALGIELGKGEEVVSITNELRAALIREREDIERQRKAWEEAQNAPKDEQATATPAQAEDTPTMTEAPAEGLQLVEIAGGVAVVGNDWKDTFYNKKAIKAHGCKWNKEGKRWEATDPDDVVRVRAWFALRDGFGTIEEKTAKEIKAEAAEEIRREEEATATPSEEPTTAQDEPTTAQNEEQPAADLAPVLSALADLLATFADIIQEAKKWEGVTIPADTLNRWREQTEAGAKNTAAKFAEVCACLGSMSPDNRKAFDALGIIFWTLSEQLRNGYDPDTINTATDYARAQLFDLIDRTQTAQQAAAIRRATYPESMGEAA